MIIIGKKESGIIYEDRRSSYSILENSEGKIAVVKKSNWGLILPGGKIEEKECPKETIKRETLEETGHATDDLKFYQAVEAYYPIRLKIGIINCRNVADFYIGKIKEKICEPQDKDAYLEFYYPEELFGKLKLDFQNVVLERFYKNNN